MSSISVLGVGAGSNALYISTSNAYVGVGKSNPAYQLDVAGSINCTGSVLVNGSALATGGSAAVCQALWYANSNTPASNYVGISTYAGTITQNNSTNGTNPFSTTTGLFTCQYTGTYECNFTSTTVVAPASVTVYKNGAAVSPGYTCYGNVNNSISLALSVYCSATDTLGFYVTQGTVAGASGGSGTQGCSISLMTSGTAATGMGVPNQVVFTSVGSSNWAIPTGVTQVQVEMVGGGGGGGGGCSTASTFYAGAGGGAGGYARFMVNASTSGTLTVTVGAAGTAGATGAAGSCTNGGTGGNSIITGTGLSVTANGGNGGGSGFSTATNQLALPGLGGTATATTSTAIQGTFMAIAGGPGQSANLGGGGAQQAGTNGGTSYFGSSGPGVIEDSGANSSAIVASAPSNGYGGGGGGGRYNAAGGAGAPGVVIITYFTQSGVPSTYTATAPLSVSGTTLSVANATSSAPGVVQVGTGLTVSSGVLNYPRYAFMAKGAQSNWGSSTAGDSPVVFSYVAYNIGSCWNSSTYTFTAPVQGIYQFSGTFNSTTASSTVNGVYAVSNGTWGTYYYFGVPTSTHNPFSFQMQLSVGATVQLKANQTYIYADANDAFAGALLFVTS